MDKCCISMRVLAVGATIGVIAGVAMMGGNVAPWVGVATMTTAIFYSLVALLSPEGGKNMCNHKVLLVPRKVVALIGALTLAFASYYWIEGSLTLTNYATILGCAVVFTELLQLLIEGVGSWIH